MVRGPPAVAYYDGSFLHVFLPSDTTARENWFARTENTSVKNIFFGSVSIACSSYECHLFI